MSEEKKETNQVNKTDNTQKTDTKNIINMSREELKKSLVEPEKKEVENDSKKTEIPENKKESGEDFKVKFESLEKESKTKDDRIANMQKVLDKLGTEVGLLRRKTPEQIKELKQKARDLILEEKDDEALAILKGIDDEEKSKFEDEIKRTEQDAINKAIESNKHAINTLIQDGSFEKSLDDVISVMKEDGTPDDKLNEIKQNPYSIPYQLTYNLFKRANMKKEISSLKSEIEKYKKDIEDLKKKPNELLKNISSASNRINIDGNAGSSNEINNIHDINPRKKGREELRKELYGT